MRSKAWGLPYRLETNVDREGRCGWKDKELCIRHVNFQTVMGHPSGYMSVQKVEMQDWMDGENSGVERKGLGIQKGESAIARAMPEKAKGLREREMDKGGGELRGR